MEARKALGMNSPALPWGVPVSPPVNVRRGGGGVGCGSDGDVNNERESVRGEETAEVGRKRTREEKEGGEVDEVARTGGAQEKKKQSVPEVKVGDRVEVLWELDDEPIVRMKNSLSLMCCIRVTREFPSHTHHLWLSSLCCARTACVRVCFMCFVRSPMSSSA